MATSDPKTAVLLAERMVGSFFDGLSKAEKTELAAGKSGRRQEELPPGLSMLAYTLDVYLEELALPEEQGREFFKEAGAQRRPAHASSATCEREVWMRARERKCHERGCGRAPL